MKTMKVLLLIVIYFGIVIGLLNDGKPKKPTMLSASVGGHTVFNCDLNFPQDIVIPYVLNWNKNGSTIFSSYDGSQLSSADYNGRILPINDGKRYGKGSINLTAIRESDLGWYECKVLFPNRTPVSRNNGTWFHLYIEGENLIVIPPVNQTAMEGDEAKFKCVTKQSDSTVNWYKDGEPVTSSPDLVRRSWVNNDGSFTIKPTSMIDFGEYMCEVMNLTGFKQTANAYLDVQYKAKVIYTPREIYLPYGRPSVLDCHFRANPSLTNLYWEKDGFLYDPYNVPGVFFKGNGSLYFDKVDESHAGLYSCTPYNDLGTEGPSPKIKVIVQRPPVFTATPNSIYLRKLGDSIMLPCDAIDSEGQRRPTLVWTKRDNSQLPEDRSQQESGNLTIENLQEDDRGIYQCSATNEAATVTTETELMIENVPPRAPYNLVATSTSNSVTLRWAPASSMITFTNPSEWSTYTRPEMEYSVWYKSSEDAEWRKMPVSSSRITEATISNLFPGREYEFMVLSQDKFSDGMFSKSIKYKTKDSSEEITSVSKEVMETTSTEIGPPRDVVVHLTPEGYLVNWSPPNHGMDLLRTYVVRWYQGPEMYVAGTAETEDTFYLLTDLQEDEIYNVEVDALSVNDYKAVSDKFILFVPAYGKIRAAIAGVGCVLMLVIIVGILWYSHHRYKSRAKQMTSGNRSK